MTETAPVTCPCRFKVFEVALPPVGETPWRILLTAHGQYPHR